MVLYVLNFYNLISPKILRCCLEKTASLFKQDLLLSLFDCPGWGKGTEFLNSRNQNPKCPKSHQGEVYVDSDKEKMERRRENKEKTNSSFGNHRGIWFVYALQEMNSENLKKKKRHFHSEFDGWQTIISPVLCGQTSPKHVAIWK